MYYEEKYISGWLCYRTSPHDGWTTKPLKTVTKRLQETQEQLEAAHEMVNAKQEHIDELKATIEGHKSNCQALITSCRLRGKKLAEQHNEIGSLKSRLIKALKKIQKLEGKDDGIVDYN